MFKKASARRDEVVLGVEQRLLRWRFALDPGLRQLGLRRLKIFQYSTGRPLNLLESLSGVLDNFERYFYFVASRSLNRLRGEGVFALCWPGPPRPFCGFGQR